MHAGMQAGRQTRTQGEEGSERTRGGRRQLGQAQDHKPYMTLPQSYSLVRFKHKTQHTQTHTFSCVLTHQPHTRASTTHPDTQTHEQTLSGGKPLPRHMHMCAHTSKLLPCGPTQRPTKHACPCMPAATCAKQAHTCVPAPPGCYPAGSAGCAQRPPGHWPTLGTRGCYSAAAAAAERAA